MAAYLPTTTAVIWTLLGGLVTTLLLGRAITRIPSAGLARGLAWGQAVVAVAAVERYCAREPPGLRMLAIIAVLLIAMKAVVFVEWSRQEPVHLTFLQWIAFAAAWPGMRPGLFRSLGGPAQAGAGRLLGRGLGCVALGLALVGVARLLWIGFGSPLLSTVPLLTGLSLVLHFGLFSVAAGLWRLAGARCEPLFRAPLRSRSLREFWARRWNLAFSEMTALAVFRPLAEIRGRPAGTFAAFLFSGLLHELAISLPVRAGFGGPLLYFALHGIAVLLEDRFEKQGSPLHVRIWVSRCWSAAWLLIPLPILFHGAFLRGVVWPIVGMAP